jgi:heme/copper-type cytochrome/quinol oxidase subunit 2
MGVKRAFLPLLALIALPAVGADRFALSVSKSGFRPARVDVRRGEPVRLSITSADGEHCFALDAFRVEKRVVPGKATVLDLTPDKAGTFPFYDCLAPEGERREGQLVVAE